MRLALDHHYSPGIAELLRLRGHDVMAAMEQGWEREDDEPLLTRCVEASRTLLTNNARDFVIIARSWTAEARSHTGLIFTSDARMSRSRDSVGRYVEALHEVMGVHPGPHALRDRVLWL